MGAVGIVAIFGALVVLGLFARIWLRPAITLAVQPERIEVVQYETEAIALVLRRQIWRGGKHYDTGGAYLLSAETGGVFSIEPARGGSHPLNSLFSVLVTGVAPGRDQLVVSATPTGESKAFVARFPVTVVPAPDGERRIRQSSAALKAK